MIVGNGVQALAQDNALNKEAYTIFAKYYDEVMDVVPYEEWVDYLESILSKWHINPATILDLGTGTGNIALALARRGYKVMGLDSSAAMLQVARQKAQTAGLEEGNDITFFEGDFRSFQLAPGPAVELAVSLYDSFNYLLTEEDLAQAFRQVSEALQVRGYFIFDMNTVLRLTTIEEGNSLVEGDEYYCFWRDELDPVGPYWRVHLTIFEEQSDGSLVREDEFHQERGYPISTVLELLSESGFAVQAVYDAFSFNPGTEESERIYIVAQKKVL